MAHDNTDALSNDVKAKLRGCETTEEIVALAREEGYELTDEQLESISGGWAGKCDDYTCTSDTCDTYARNIGE